MFRLWSIWAAIFSCALFVAGNVTNSNKEYNCVTRECFIDNIKYALDLMKNMNDSVDPCENFYEYACGNFDDLPHAPKIMNRFQESVQIMRRTLDAFIFDPKSSNKSKPFNFMSNFMVACQDLSHNNDYTYLDAKEDKLDFLKEVILKLGGWPVIEGDKWNETDFDWIQFVRKSESIGYFIGQTFFNFFANYTDSDSPVSFNLNPPFLELSWNGPAYYNYMINVAKFLGANETRAKIDLMEAFKFESQMSAAASIIGNPEINSMSVEEIERTWPSINWSEYFSNHLHPYFSVENKTLINISNTNYIKKFETLINTTSKRAQANYAIWKIIEFSIPLTKSVTLYNFAKTYGTLRQAPDTNLHYCIAEAQLYLSKLALANLARSHPIDPKARRSAHQIFSKIKNKFLDALKSDTSKSQANEEIIKKIENVKVVYGYPDELLDDKKLEEYFRGLEITRDNYLANFLSIQTHHTKMSQRMMSKSQDAYDWKDILSAMNSNPVIMSLYHPHGNFIEISSVLSNFFINTNRHNYTNYGGIGTIIGSQLATIVDILRKSSKDYPSNNVDNCILEQYNNYIGGNGTKENSSLFQNTITTQQVGLKFAYLAYQEWVNEHGEEPKLANLYSPNKLFWLSHANAHCAPKSLQQLNITGFLTFDKQINWGISNIPQFSNDYNCPLGSSMNPKNKCIDL
ncbi:neprilysin-2 [Microplitis demolitor]|uniref:neprilysin-2 n=1 Tax=Microplitis demolitor TaxID=69319 RepID=UPI0004CDCA1E|nr:neprilysin-2 [Microplitis demolitor]